MRFDRHALTPAPLPGERESSERGSSERRRPIPAEGSTLRMAPRMYLNLKNSIRFNSSSSEVCSRRDHYSTLVLVMQEFKDWDRRWSMEERFGWRAGRALTPAPLPRERGKFGLGSEVVDGSEVRMEAGRALTPAPLPRERGKFGERGGVAVESPPCGGRARRGFLGGSQEIF